MLVPRRVIWKDGSCLHPPCCIARELLGEPGGDGTGRIGGSTPERWPDQREIHWIFHGVVCFQLVILLQYLLKFKFFMGYLSVGWSVDLGCVSFNWINYFEITTVDAPAPFWGLIAYSKLPLKSDPYLDENTLNTSSFGIQKHQTRDESETRCIVLGLVTLNYRSQGHDHL